MTSYAPRRRNRQIDPMPALPEYFKTVTWDKLQAKLEMANTLVFMIFKNGGVQNVYVKEINKNSGTDENAGIEATQETVEANNAIQSKPGSQIQGTPAEESNQPPAEEEIPEEESATLPPEKPEASVETPLAPKETPKPEEKAKNKTTVEEGHRVLASYKGVEVKGNVIHIIEDNKSGKYVLQLDDGAEVLVGGDDLLKLLIPSATVSK